MAETGKNLLNQGRNMILNGNAIMESLNKALGLEGLQFGKELALYYNPRYNTTYVPTYLVFIIVFFVDLGLIGVDTFAILGGICVALKKLYDNRTGNGQPSQELEEIQHQRSNIPQQQGELQQQQLNDVIQQVIRALPIQQQLQPQQGGQQHNINVRGPIGQTYDSNRLRGVAATPEPLMN